MRTSLCRPAAAETAWDSYLRALRVVAGPLTLTCMAQTWETHAKAALLGEARYGAGCRKQLWGTALSAWTKVEEA